VRWVAVRHADNHVHVVATLVRQDGRGCSRTTTSTVPVRPASRSSAGTADADQCCGPDGHAGDDPREQRKHQRAVRAAADAGRPAPVGPDREVLRARVRRRWPERRTGSSSPGGCDCPGCCCVSGTAAATPVNSPATPCVSCRRRRRHCRAGGGLVRWRQARSRPVPAAAARPLGARRRCRAGPRR
jgi:hypothetical protein